MCHVLIIEDDFATAFYLKDVVESLGATSCEIVDCEAEAVAAARAQPPGIITSDVHLREGTGPRAVAAIIDHLGHIPTIFVTASPEECEPCEQPHQVHVKPINEARFSAAFVQLAPL